VKDPAALALGLLFHDIGKGRGGSHSPKGARIAETVCARLGLDSGTTEDVLFLVQKHLVMSHVSQRRDLSDHALIEGFADTVSSVDRLNMLLILTYADANAVGPGVWNDWKAALLWELYSRTRAHLTGEHSQATDGDRRARLMEKVVEGLFPEFLKRDVEEHLSLFPERYLRAAAPDAIARHFQLVQHLGVKHLVADWRTSTAGRYTILTVCTRDAPGLLAHLAGTLTGHGLNILSVDAFTRSDGIVLDTFRLCETVGVAPVRPERWPAIEADLVSAVEGRHDVEAAVARSRSRAPKRGRRRPPTSPAVQFDFGAEVGPTVIEVRADDEPGLVYRIASTLTALGLNIVLAKIATEKSHALDVFYVTDAAGQGLLKDATKRVEEAIVSALAPRPSTAS
jgi:[protein-PII] uridylyltransferase